MSSLSTIQAFPCMTDGKNIVSLLMIPCFDGAQRLAWSLCCVMQMAMADATESQLTGNKGNY